jgi:predicted aspartyl protease
MGKWALMSAIGRFVKLPHGPYARPAVDVLIGGQGATIARPATALIDTGAEASIVHPSVWPGGPPARFIPINGTSGTSQGGIVAARIHFGSISYAGEILLGGDLTEGLPILLGMDVLRHLKLEMNYAEGTVRLETP